MRANIKRDGCRDPLVTWNGTLLDGHNRYQFCIAEGIKFKTVEVKGVGDRNEAKAWIIRKQLGQRNLNQFQKGELGLELYEVTEKAKGKANQKMSKGRGKKGYPNLENLNEPPIRTNKKIGDMVGIAHNNVHKVRVIKNEGDEKLIQKVRSGEVSLDKGFKEVRRERRRYLKTSPWPWLFDVVTI